MHNFKNFQEFSMPENHRAASGSRRNAAPDNTWGSYYNLRMMNSGDEYNTNIYPDLPLLEFSRLNLADPPQSPNPQLPMPPCSGHIPVNGSNDSIIRNNGFSNHLPLSYEQSIRANSLGRGLYNDDQYVAGNLNGSYYDYDSDYDHYGYNSGRYLIGTEDFHLPRSNYRNGLSLSRNGMRLGNGANFHDQSQIDSTPQGYRLNSRQTTNFSSLEDLRGKIVLVAKDQHGGRFLQKKIDEGRAEDLQMIFSEVKDHVRELMVHQFGNYLIQKLFEVCSEEQMTQLLLLVINDERNLMAICLDINGTRVMQKMIEHVTTSGQRSLVVTVLRRITVPLTKSLNGHHVIQHCFKYFPTEDNKHILNVVVDNCLDIATDKSGCCVLQQCVVHAQGEPRERLMTEITTNALVLSEHPYGNYVVQYILGLKIPHVTAEILARLAGGFVLLSVNKYGSNVVEKCLRESEGDHALEIIKELIFNPSNFLMVLQDPYGNYVAQSALSVSKGAVRHRLISLIQDHYAFLHSHPHGKRVLACAKGGRYRM